MKKLLVELVTGDYQKVRYGMSGLRCSVDQQELSSRQLNMWVYFGGKVQVGGCIGSHQQTGGVRTM